MACLATSEYLEKTVDQDGQRRETSAKLERLAFAVNKDPLGHAECLVNAESKAKKDS